MTKNRFKNDGKLILQDNEVYVVADNNHHAEVITEALNILIKENNELKQKNNNTYFYQIAAYGYEETIEKQYYSTIKYTQNEFENILFQAMQELMEQILEEEPESLCYYNIFFKPDDLILHKDFDKYLEEKGLQLLNNKINNRITFNLNKPNKYADRLNKVFTSLTIDESCKENDCSRIADLPEQEKEYLKKYCGVTIRK